MNHTTTKEALLALAFAAAVLAAMFLPSAL